MKEANISGRGTRMALPIISVRSQRRPQIHPRSRCKMRVLPATADAIRDMISNAESEGFSQVDALHFRIAALSPDTRSHGFRPPMGRSFTNAPAEKETIAH